MTPTEVLGEIQKMPFDQREQLYLALSEELNHTVQTNLGAKERNFINKLRRKGLVAELPLNLPDDAFRRNFRRIEVKGEPLSETIIKERG